MSFARKIFARRLHFDSCHAILVFGGNALLLLLLLVAAVVVVAFLNFALVIHFQTTTENGKCVWWRWSKGWKRKLPK